MSDVQFSPFFLNPVNAEPEKPSYEVEVRPWSPPVQQGQIQPGLAPQEPVMKIQDYATLELPSFQQNQERAQAILKQPEKKDPIMAIADFVCALAFPAESQVALRMEIFDILTVEVLRARKLSIENANYRVKELTEDDQRNSEHTEKETDTGGDEGSDADT